MSNGENVQGDAAQVVKGKTTKVRGGHKANLKKILKDVDDCLKDFDMGREPQLLAFREALERKADIITKLDSEILDVIEDEDEIGVEIAACDTVQLHIRLEGPNVGYLS